MRSDSSVTVNYANLNPAFMKFQEQYKNLCQNISTNKKRNIIKSLKMTSSFYFEYKIYVISKELRDKFDRYLLRLKKELYSDEVFTKLCGVKKKSPNESIIFNQKYYYYLVKIAKAIGMLGDELSRTFMPNKTDRQKLIKFWNNNSFFEQFTHYKSLTADKIANFTLRDFKDSFSYFMGFYFAYYLFIDEKSRHICEKVFSNILNIFLNKEILNLVVSDFNSLSSDKKIKFNEIDFILHDGINRIFSRCNYSYSAYGIMPRIQQKVLIDRTAI